MRSHTTAHINFHKKKEEVEPQKKRKNAAAQIWTEIKIQPLYLQTKSKPRQESIKNSDEEIGRTQVSK